MIYTLSNESKAMVVGMQCAVYLWCKSLISVLQTRFDTGCLSKKATGRINIMTTPYDPEVKIQQQKTCLGSDSKPTRPQPWGKFALL